MNDVIASSHRSQRVSSFPFSLPVRPSGISLLNEYRMRMVSKPTERGVIERSERIPVTEQATSNRSNVNMNSTVVVQEYSACTGRRNRWSPCTVRHHRNRRICSSTVGPSRVGVAKWFHSVGGDGGGNAAGMRMK